MYGVEVGIEDVVDDGGIIVAKERRYCETP